MKTHTHTAAAASCNDSAVASSVTTMLHMNMNTRSLPDFDIILRVIIFSRCEAKRSMN